MCLGSWILPYVPLYQHTAKAWSGQLFALAKTEVLFRSQKPDSVLCKPLSAAVMAEVVICLYAGTKLWLSLHFGTEAL